MASRNNENVLLLTPLSLVLVVLLPRALKGRAGAVRAAVKVASVVAGLALLALLIKVLPWFHQYNLELIALILPVHAGLLSASSEPPRRPSVAVPPSRSPRTSTAAPWR